MSDLLYDILGEMAKLHEVVIESHLSGYCYIDDDCQEWFKHHNLTPQLLVGLTEIPNNHTGKVYCWIFDPEDANSNFFFEDANMAILFKLTFGGR